VTLLQIDFDEQAAKQVFLFYRHSPWWIVGPIEQRFTGYEFDETRRKGVGFDRRLILRRHSPRHRKGALAPSEEGGTRTTPSVRPFQSTRRPLQVQLLYSKEAPRASWAFRMKRLRSEAFICHRASPLWFTVRVDRRDKLTMRLDRRARKFVETL